MVTGRTTPADQALSQFALSSEGLTTMALLQRTPAQDRPVS